ncbi:uncharacterized protein LOC144201317 [Stigmatopora nigra]
MQLPSAKLPFVAFLMGYLALVAAGPGIKITNCCTKSTLGHISAPIIGYRIQRKNLPCIQAVVFETTEGEVCSHWKQDWIIHKLKEIEQARKAQALHLRTETNTTAS